jgi:hypothetical protein
MTGNAKTHSIGKHATGIIEKCNDMGPFITKRMETTREKRQIEKTSTKQSI